MKKSGSEKREQRQRNATGLSYAGLPFFAAISELLSTVRSLSARYGWRNAPKLPSGGLYEIFLACTALLIMSFFPKNALADACPDGFSSYIGIANVECAAPVYGAPKYRFGSGQTIYPTLADAQNAAISQAIDANGYCTAELDGSSTWGCYVAGGGGTCGGWWRGELSFYAKSFGLSATWPRTPINGIDACSVNLTGGIGVSFQQDVTCPSGYSVAGNTYYVRSNDGTTLEYIPQPNPRAACFRETFPYKAEKNKGKACIGNPCNAGTGLKVQREVLYSGKTLKFEATYNSSNADVPVGNGQYRIGMGWAFNYGMQLTQIDSRVVTVSRPDGRLVSFRANGNQYASDSDVADTLEKWMNGSTFNGWFFFDAATMTKEIYNTTGKLIAINPLAGGGQTLTYSTTSTPVNIAPLPGLLIRVTDAFGKQLNFIYDQNSHITQITDPAGNAYTLAYDGASSVVLPGNGAAGNLTSVTAPDASVKIYHYNEQSLTSNTNLPNALTGITDSGSRYSFYAYDSQGRVISTEHAGSVEKYTIGYASPHVTSIVTDPLGASRTYTFQTINDVVKTTGISQSCSNCEIGANASYDANGNVTSETDFNGNQTIRSYDLTRNLETSRTEAYGTSNARTITTQWHSFYRLPMLITEGNRTTGLNYNGNGWLATKTITDAATSTSRVWTYYYDSYGRVETADGPRTDVSDITTFTYYGCSTGSQCGQLQTLTDPLGRVTTYNTYNAHGLPLTITDPNGVVTTLTYDTRQRLTSRTVGSETSSFQYWPTGLLKKVTLPDSSYLAYTYDAAHRLTRIDDTEGNHVVYTLDAMENRTAESTYDPGNVLARLQTRTYNALNQLWKEIGAANTAAVTTTYGYDNNGNQTTISAPLARNTSQIYDELNRLKQVTDPANGVTQYGYDANDNLTSATDPRSKITTYQYNGFGDLKQQTSPDTATTTNTFDSGGNLYTSTDARSKTATYSYDALNRLTQRAYPDQTLGFAYDAGTYGKGHLTAAADGNHSMAWTYNAQGRILGKGQTVGSITKSVGYGYANGNPTSLVTPSGQTITFGYTNGRVTSISVNGSTLLNNVLYESFSTVRSWRWGNGTYTTREYDTDGRLSAFDSAGRSTFTFYPDNSIQSRNDETLSTFNVVTGTATFAVSSTSNQLTSVSGALTRSYGYDAAGHITSDGTRTFTYNDAGRMSSATSGGITTTFTINALGQRVKKSNSGSTTYFVYDEAGHLLGEYNASGALIQEIVWFGEIPVASLQPNGSGVSVLYVHTDHLNAPTKLTRSTDNIVVWRWDHDAFGNGVPNQDPDGNGSTVVFNLRYPGQYYDGETGLNYNYFRDYDPAIGRYVQSDPIGLAGGLNLYAYVKGNPLGFVDPFGLDAQGACDAESDRALNERAAAEALAQGDFIGYAKFKGLADRALQRYYEQLGYKNVTLPSSPLSPIPPRPANVPAPFAPEPVIAPKLPTPTVIPPKI